MAKYNIRGASLGQIVSGGVISGVVAGIAMALFAMVQSGLSGLGFWLPLKLVTVTAFGIEALIGGVGTIFLGFAIHMIVSGLFGAAYAALFGRVTSSSAAFVIGVGYGIVVWAVMTYAILPQVNEPLYQRVALVPGWWFVNHLVYGGFLGLTPAVEEAVKTGVEEPYIPEKAA